MGYISYILYTYIYPCEGIQIISVSALYAVGWAKTKLSNLFVKYPKYSCKDFLA